MSGENKQGFAEALLEWYDQNARDLPWRRVHTPYAIWISEIMLQQTQVVTVIDYYKRFMARFPDVYRLSEAAEDEVFKCWEGLGYYSRARHMMQAAHVIVSELGGVFPEDRDALLKLPGIGPYTAGAIASIAYNEPVPAVDGNVLRVMARVYADGRDIGNPKNRNFFETLVMAHMPDRSGDFNQALMELGACVCTPKQPDCENCPVKMFCDGYKNGNPTDYPIKLPKAAKSIHDVSVLVLRHMGKIAVVRRPEGGLMSGLWGFPVVMDEDSETAHLNYFESHLGYTVTRTGLGPKAKHIFTHRVWNMQVYYYDFKDPEQGLETVDDPELRWVSKKDMEALAFPTAFKKLFKGIDFFRKGD